MSDYKEQKSIKPKIEDVVNSLLEDNKKQEALGFIAYIKSLRMTPQWASTNSWALSYKNKRVGYIKIYADVGDWWLWLYSQYDERFQELVSGETDDIKEFILNNIVYCCKCAACAPGKNMTFLGNELKNVCLNPNIRVRNPKGKYCEFAKKLIGLRRSAIENNMIPKNSYIAVKNRK